MAYDMREIHRYEDVVLLGDGDVREIAGPLVSFADGSTADLLQMAIRNRGGNDLQMVHSPMVASGAESRTQRLASSPSNILLRGDFLEVEVRAAALGDDRVEILGDPAHVAAIRMEESGGTLMISTPSLRQDVTVIHVGTIVVNGRRLAPDPVPARIVVWVSNAPSVSIKGSGHGSVLMLVPAGDISVETQGSIRVFAVTATHLAVRISGSGTVRVREVTGSCSATISGSGDVSIGHGHLDRLDAEVSGSGSIAVAATVRLASLVLTGSGSIWVARVTEESVERQVGSGGVSVAARGPGSF